LYNKLKVKIINIQGTLIFGNVTKFHQENEFRNFFVEVRFKKSGSLIAGGKFPDFCSIDVGGTILYLSITTTTGRGTNGWRLNNSTRKILQ
jgi:hypothetical protein